MFGMCFVLYRLCTQRAQAMAYRVYALDHQHCHDKGVFATLDDAIAVCIQMNHEYQCFA